VKETIWLSGIVISCVSIPLGLLFAGGDVFSASSYKPLLPSITFIAASIATVCLLEAVEILMEVDRDKLNDGIKIKLFVWVLSVIASSFFYYTTFIYNIVRVIKGGYTVGWSAIILNVAMVVVAAVLAIRVRRALEGYK
jgi:hypothetical protein